jgi:hypothetical protein
MGVLIPAEYFRPDVDGAGTSARLNVAESLYKKGSDVTVVTALSHYPLEVPSSFDHKVLMRDKIGDSAR